MLGADGIEGVVLRYANLYGPGTRWSEGGEMLELVPGGGFRSSESGAGIWSFVHVDDAASATVGAGRAGAPGVYNVADDVPAAARRVAPRAGSGAWAQASRVTSRTGSGGLAAGAASVSMLRGSGAPRTRARRELGWRPRHPSWRDGFGEGPADALPLTARAA